MGEARRSMAAYTRYTKVLLGFPPGPPQGDHATQLRVRPQPAAPAEVIFDER